MSANLQRVADDLEAAARMLRTGTRGVGTFDGPFARVVRAARELPEAEEMPHLSPPLSVPAAIVDLETAVQVLRCGRVNVPQRVAAIVANVEAYLARKHEAARAA